MSFLAKFETRSAEPAPAPVVGQDLFRVAHESGKAEDLGNGGVVNLQLNKRNSRNAIVVACGGMLVCGEDLRALPHCVRESVSRAEPIVINLAGITKIDCAGLGALAQCANYARMHNQQVILCSVPRRLRQLLALTRLDTVLAIHADEQRALERCTGYAA